MTTVAEAAADLIAALKTVDKLRVISDGTAALDPPCALLGPPQLDWTAYNGPGPGQATFVVLIAVPADDRATERLWDLVVTVAAAVESVVDAVVRSAFPISVTVGQSADLPAYQLQVEMSL
jgi:hypothetical protein